MSVIDTLITDRDINSFYNASDLNRVGEAIQYIADKIYALGYEIHVSPKTNWVEADIPLPNQMAHYLEDLRTIRAVLSQPQRTPPVPPEPPLPPAPPAPPSPPLPVTDRALPPSPPVPPTPPEVPDSPAPPSRALITTDTVLVSELVA